MGRRPDDRAPLTVVFRNTEARPADYGLFADQPRPATPTSWPPKIRGFNDIRGGHFRAGSPGSRGRNGGEKLIALAEISARLVEAEDPRTSSPPSACVEAGISPAASSSAASRPSCRARRAVLRLGESLVAHDVLHPGIKGVEFDRVRLRPDARACATISFSTPGGPRRPTTAEGSTGLTNGNDLRSGGGEASVEHPEGTEVVQHEDRTIEPSACPAPRRVALRAPPSEAGRPSSWPT
jgi:hypothetical protein